MAAMKAPYTQRVRASLVIARYDGRDGDVGGDVHSGDNVNPMPLIEGEYKIRPDPLPHDGSQR